MSKKHSKKDHRKSKKSDRKKETKKQPIDSVVQPEVGPVTLVEGVQAIQTDKPSAKKEKKGSQQKLIRKRKRPKM